MKGNQFYYKKFEEILQKDDPNIAAEFVSYAKDNPPLIVNIWLMNNKKRIASYAELEPYMKDFFWENY